MTDPRPAPGHAGLRARVLENLERTVHALADEVRPIGPGWVVRKHDLPDVWTLNQLHVTEHASARDVIALSDEHQADLRYRHVIVDDEATASELQNIVAGLGWKIDREVLMVLMEQATRNVEAHGVVELNENEASSLMRHWIIEEHPEIASGGLEQLEEYNRREGRLWRERCLGVRDRAGQPSAITKLRSHDAVAWVEDVYTLPEQRGRGFARMLVNHAIELAAAVERDLIFIVADDNDWPKHLYAEVGFRPVGLRWLFHRAGVQ